MKKLWKILVPVLALAVIFACVFAFASSADDTTVTIPDGTVAEGSGTNVVAIIRGGASVGQYDTLKAARDAVAESGDTIKVLIDFKLTTSSLNMSLPKKTVTVDLNGKTIYADGTLTGQYNNTFMPSAGAKWSFISSAKDADGNTVRGRFVYTDTSVAPVFSMNNSDGTTEINVENVDFIMRGTGSVFNATRAGKVTVKNSSISLTGSNAYPMSIDGGNAADVTAVFENVDLSSKTPCVNINKATNSATVTMNNVRFNTRGRFIDVGQTEEKCKTSVTLTDCTLITSNVNDGAFTINGGKLAITGECTRINMTQKGVFIQDKAKNSDVTLGYGIRFAENSFKSDGCAQLTAAQSQIVKDGLYGDTYPYVYGATKLWYENDGSKVLENWGGATSTAGNEQVNNSNKYAKIASFSGGATQGSFFSSSATDFPLDETRKYLVIEMDFAALSELTDGGVGEIILNPITSAEGFLQDNSKILRIGRSSDGGVRFYFGGGSKAEKTVPLRQWAHISIVYRLYAAEGEKTAISVFIDGEHLATIEDVYRSVPEFIHDVRYKFSSVSSGAACYDNIRIASYAGGDFEDTVFAETPTADSAFLGSTGMQDLPGAKISGTGEYYRTLALAVKAAKANDTITLVEDSTDEVVVDKPLSIDAGGHVLAGITTHRLMSHENVGELHTFKVTGIKMNLTLYSDFTANLYIPAPDGYEGETVTIGGKAYYVVKEDFDADKVAEKRSVNVEGLDITVSILSYAKALFALDESALMKNEKTLMADALVYANAAAKLIGGKENADITALLTANESYKSTLLTFDGVEKDMTAVSDGFASASLDLTAQPKFIFSIKSGASVSVSYTNFWGTRVTKTEADAVDGRIVIDDMRIFDFANEFTLTVGEKSATYSLADYAAGTDVKDLCNALYTYIETAKAFKTANPAPEM